MDVMETINNIATQVGPSLQALWWQVCELYWYLDSFSDAKLEGWPLMSNPLGVLVLLSLYLAFVFHGWRYAHGPRKHRNETILSMFMLMYNMYMSLLNAWIAFELVYCGLQLDYNFLCQLVYPGTDNIHETRIAHALWWYFASKGIELLDTILIIVRQKSSQLTFLHIYHHSTMFLVWWVGAKFVPGGSALSGALVNCVVHVVMYAYYALATLGPSVRAYLGWKKYLTILQLIQFSAGVTLGLSSIVSGCAFTRWMQYVFVAYAFSFLILFGKFYATTYKSRPIKSAH